MPIELRPYRPDDAGALDAICIRTGHHGGDASGIYREPALLCELYLRPYLALAPELAFVLAEGDAVLGYIVGTDDTRGFEARCAQAWWPAARARHPSQPDEHDMSSDAQLLRRLHGGLGNDALPFLDSHPAHLHIDLLPQAQGQGWGGRLMRRLLAALGGRGAPGVHLGVSARNPAALAFYQRQGFETLQAMPWGRWMGRRLPTA